jgi:chorismate mutase
MTVRGIRGATTTTENSSKAILIATREMLREIISRNELEPDTIASAIFTTTPDLNADFPAVAARQLGWNDVPLMCGHEMAVPGSLQQCVRVLIHVNTDKPASEIQHVYLKGAVNLRSKTPPIEE